MGNRQSAGTVDAANSAYDDFEKLFSEFLSSRLLHHSESRHFLTLDEVLRSFSSKFPDHQRFVSGVDESSHGWLINYAVRLIELQFGSCIMVAAAKACPFYYSQRNLGEKMTSYYKFQTATTLSKSRNIQTANNTVTIRNIKKTYLVIRRNA